MGTEETSKKESASVRKVWVVNETPDSNPQLAENLSLLGDALHMELELVQTEAWIGHYNSDILAGEMQSNAAIIIEHRSVETYHYQLGQVLACAENYNARILIWIADNFREEHRSALDWLNRWTPAEVEVYGVEIHSTHESDANANLKFVPVIAPTSWSKRSEGRPIAKIQSIVLREFFQGLLVNLHNADEFKDIEKLVTKHDQSFPSGLSGVNYHASFESGHRVWVYISAQREDKGQIFGKPRAEKKAIECELKLASDSKTGIEWNTEAGNIGIWRDGSLNDSEEELEEIRNWMFEYLLKFKKVFNPRMENIIAELESD